MKLDYDSLIDKLKKNGFEVNDKISYNDGQASFDNGKVRGIVAKENHSDYIYTNGRLAADNINCFDKLSKCPLIMKLPIDWEELQRHFLLLGSKYGEEISGTYDYNPGDPFPIEV